MVAFFSFGLCASATYIINDLLDLEADRKHPRKRRRPFAAGDLSAIAGVSAVVVMMAASFALAMMVPQVILDACRERTACCCRTSSWSGCCCIR